MKVRIRVGKFVLIGFLFLLPLLGLAEERKAKYGPRVAPLATPLALSHEFFQDPKNRAPDFWSLVSYYVPQFNGAACSVASVAMILNAGQVERIRAQTSEDKILSQEQLLDQVKVENWRERMSALGFKGSHGISLDRLGKVLQAAASMYGFPNAKVSVIHVNSKDRDSKLRLVKDLKANEASANDFIIANFNQKVFTDDAEVGHFAPVGAFDEEKDRVLIFDPDREYYEPYWVSVDTFLAGMATKDHAGVENRGYLWIQLRSRH